MNIKGRAKEAAFLDKPHILQPQGNIYKGDKYYCNFTRTVYEQKPDDIKDICYGCNRAKLKRG